MRTFLRVVVGLIFVFVFVLLLLLTTVRFKFLDSNFVNVTLRNSDVYSKIEYLVRSALRERLQEELQQKGKEFEQLSVGEQEFIVQMMEGTISAVTSDTIQDLIETNTVRLWRFVKGEKDSITAYLPVRKWGVPEIIIENTPMAQFSENTEIELLFTEPGEVEEFYRVFGLVREIILTLNSIWVISLVTLVILFVVHFLLSKSAEKILRTAYLFIITGAITLLLSGGAFLLANRAMSKVGDLVEPAKLLINAIIPQLVLGVVKLWLMFGGGFIIVGMIAFALNNLLERRKTAQIGLQS